MNTKEVLDLLKELVEELRLTSSLYLTQQDNHPKFAPDGVSNGYTAHLLLNSIEGFSRTIQSYRALDLLVSSSLAILDQQLSKIIDRVTYQMANRDPSEPKSGIRYDPGRPVGFRRVVTARSSLASDNLDHMYAVSADINELLAALREADDEALEMRLLIEEAPVVAELSNGRLKAISDDISALGGVSDVRDFNQRLAAQIKLADILIEMLQPKYCNLHPRVLNALQRYRVSLINPIFQWYEVDDRMASVIWCRNEAKDEQWPDASPADLAQLIRRHDELSTACRGRSFAIRGADVRFDEEKITDEAAAVISGLAERAFAEQDDLFDESAVNVKEYYREKIRESQISDSTSPSDTRRRKFELTKAVKGIGGFFASALETLKGLDEFWEKIQALQLKAKPLIDFVISLIHKENP